MGQITNLQPATSTDDGNWTTSSYSSNAADIWVDPTNKNWMRFPGLAIPQGATITAATLTLRSKGNYDYTLTNRLHAFDEDNASYPTSYGDAEGRTLTTAYTDWTLVNPRWDIDYTSPSIVDIVKEIVDRPGWVSGNALILRIFYQSGDVNGIAFSSYDYNTSTCARLNVTYEGGDTPGSISSTIEL